MKKTIAILLALVMLLGLCACGAKEEEPAGSVIEDVNDIVDYGDSQIYTDEDIAPAVKLIEDQIGSWEGAELTSLRYAGDEAVTEENLAWMNELEGADAANPFTQVIEFISDFHVGDAGETSFEANHDYTDYQWWLARTEGGEWQLMTWGY